MTSSAANTDEEILQLLANDNPKSISLMYQAHQEAVLRRIKNIVVHPHDAEDIMQDLFLAIWEKRQILKLVPPLRGYLLAAAHNRALNFLVQKARSRVAYIDTISVILQDEPADQQASHRRQLNSRMKKAIRMLPQKTRIVYLLSRNFRLSNLEIARQLNVSVKTVEKHITKALKLLRKFLSLSLVVVYWMIEY
jgi:RNA polymerase sigma-70 factor (family 1)